MTKRYLCPSPNLLGWTLAPRSSLRPVAKVPDDFRTAPLTGLMQLFLLVHLPRPGSEHMKGWNGFGPLWYCTHLHKKLKHRSLCARKRLLIQVWASMTVVVQCTHDPLRGRRANSGSVLRLHSRRLLA